MIFNSISSERPQVQAWGHEMSIVPINVREGQNIDEDGNIIPVFYADLVQKVINPITVDSIVAAAVSEVFTKQEIDYVILHVADEKDPLVKRYKEFVAYVTEGAKNEGY